MSATATTPSPEELIVFADVSKFYGEILGVNGVSLALSPGITSLVGPNGSGKTTLLNLLAGLLRPTRGRVQVLGIDSDQPDRLHRVLGYATQYDSFPAGVTGRRLLTWTLALHGYPRREAADRAAAALERVGLSEAADRRVAGYSKGMRQRIKLAQATCHDPRVLLLDEPLNGLDPMSRAEMIDFFKQQAGAGRHVIVSSHILHEVDLISDQVVLVNSGYVVAEGDIRAVREEMEDHPVQVLVRCDRPHLLAARVFVHDHVVEARILEDGAGALFRTRNASGFYRLLNRVVLEDGLAIEAVAPADENVEAVYQYLIGEPR
jgi:ABC-2 type transport system ATP-binding protein